MAPSLVEKRNMTRGGEREYWCGYGCLAIDLMTEEDLWIEKIDGLVKENYPKDELDNVKLKYIVKGDRVFVFDAKINHKDFLLISDIEGELQSAGFISFIFRQTGVVRHIYGDSSSLQDYLSTEESDEYKEEVMKPRLESHFGFF